MSQLCNAFQDTFWPRLKWPDFASIPEKDKVEVILPIIGFSDLGDGLPLDQEEQVSMSMLMHASQSLHSTMPHLILPPQRYVTGSIQSSFFTMEPDEVYEAIAEIVLSIKASGFRKVVFYNSSPWNEDLLDATARDLRIELGMQTFCIHLSGLGIDLSVQQVDGFLEQGAKRLASLLIEVGAKPALANDGKIPQQKGDA
ncbi:creatininase family protein [Opitutia bacterium ISCC 51]|nr:creatininase family protein [Opitutae bacterium ISCC 51]QXD30146.1 creatininase family protein [Opitutae bacterium ISCC 52]